MLISLLLLSFECSVCTCNPADTARTTLAAPPQSSVASVAVLPTTLSLAPGAKGQFAASTKDAAGKVMTGPSIAWTSSVVGAAKVSPTGLVTAIAPGSTIVTATSGGHKATAAVSVTAPAPPTTLRQLAARRGFAVGTAVEINAYRADAQYRKTLASQYNSVVAENAMKFAAVHPTPTTYTFADADTIVAFAQANGMAIHGHTLVWHTALPTWITSGTFTRAQLLSVLKSHIMTVVGRYRGKIDSWDVVNEAIMWNGTARPSVWLSTIGPDYIDSAYVWAHQADPAAKLYYNDDSQELSAVMADSVLALMQRLRSRGVPIDGLGFQMHLMANPASSNYPLSAAAWQAAFAGFTNAGFLIRVSEMDEGIPNGGGSSTLAAQGAAYRDVLDACLHLPQCTGFMTWGFTDRYSWIPGFYSGYGRGLPFDSAYKPKPAFDSLASRLQRP